MNIGDVVDWYANMELMYVFELIITASNIGMEGREITWSEASLHRLVSYTRNTIGGHRLRMRELSCLQLVAWTIHPLVHLSTLVIFRFDFSSSELMWILTQVSVVTVLLFLLLHRHFSFS